jgi:hypothetical protein
MPNEPMDDVTTFVLEQWDEIARLERAKTTVIGSFPKSVVEALRDAVKQRGWWRRDWKLEQGSSCVYFSRRPWKQKPDGDELCLFLYGLELTDFDAEDAEERSYIGLQMPRGRHRWKTTLRRKVQALLERRPHYLEGDKDEDEALKRVLPPLHPPGFAGPAPANLDTILAALDELAADVLPLIEEALE